MIGKKVHQKKGKKRLPFRKKMLSAQAQEVTRVSLPDYLPVGNIQNVIA